MAQHSDRSRANGTPTFDPVKRCIRTARDLAEWLRVDFTYQGVLNVFNILQAMGADRDAANPYTASATQRGRRARSRDNTEQRRNGESEPYVAVARRPRPALRMA